MIGNPYRECENKSHQERRDSPSAGSECLAGRGTSDRGRARLSDRDPGGCLYGLAPSSPNEKLRKTSSARAWQL